MVVASASVANVYQAFVTLKKWEPGCHWSWVAAITREVPDATMQHVDLMSTSQKLRLPHAQKQGHDCICCHEVVAGLAHATA